MDLVPKGENNKRAGHSSSSPVKCSCCLPLSALATPGIAPLYIVSCWVIENYMKRYLGHYFWGAYEWPEIQGVRFIFWKYLFRKMSVTLQNYLPVNLIDSNFCLVFSVVLVFSPSFSFDSLFIFGCLSNV